MKTIAFVGSRLGAPHDVLERIFLAVLSKHPGFRLVSGGAPGIDSQSEALARKHGLPEPIVYPADWKAVTIAERALRARAAAQASGHVEDGARADVLERAAHQARERVRARGHDPIAGHARNSCILALHSETCPDEHREHGQTDAVVALVDPGTKGTRDTLHKALRAGIPMLLYSRAGERYPHCPCRKPEKLHPLLDTGEADTVDLTR